MSAKCAMVTLHTGKTVPKGLVTSTTKHLASLLRRDPVIVCDLVALARDPEKDTFPYYCESLDNLGLTECGFLDADTREIVVAVTKGGDWFDIELVDPFVSPA